MSWRLGVDTVAAIDRMAEEAGMTRSAWVEATLLKAAAEPQPETLLGVLPQPEVVLVGALPPGVLRCPCGCHRGIQGRHPDRECACLNPDALILARRERLRRHQQGETDG